MEKNIDKPDGFFVKTEYHLEKIKFDQLLFVESSRDNIKIYLAEKVDPVITQMTIKDLEDQLPSSEFMRVHRSFIVNLRAIDLVERNRIGVGNQYIPVAESYKSEFQKYLKKTYIVNACQLKFSFFLF